MSSVSGLIYPLLYLDVPTEDHDAGLALQEAKEEGLEKPIAFSKEEVDELLRSAQEAAIAQTTERLRREAEKSLCEAQGVIAQRLREFEAERLNYFRSVESEVTQLAFAIAGKIVAREAEVDPTLLSGLVHIALDRMQAGGPIRVRVPSSMVAYWEAWAVRDTGESRWEVAADDTLEASSCIVETASGSADFSFKAQLQSLEESFAQLLSCRPAA